MDSHLIVGNSEDYHAVAVAWALRQLGESALIWDGINPEPMGHLSIQPGLEPAVVSLGGTSHRRFRSVWHRRPIRHREVEGLAEHTKAFVDRELLETHGCLMVTVSSMAPFVVGGESAMSLVKSQQLALAAKMGFKIPETLISNDYAQVRNFVSSVERVAVKPFAPHFWHDATNSTIRFASTNIIDRHRMPSEESVNACPSIYQQFIDKRHELRVTVVGEHIFVAKISKADGSAYVDWRMYLEAPETMVEATTLEPELEALIVSFVATAGLNYGCIDLVVDQDGTTYFLEINPGGQFLFVEQLLPQFQILNAFTSMLRAQSRVFNVESSELITTKEFEQSESFNQMMASRGTLVNESSLHTAMQS